LARRKKKKRWCLSREEGNLTKRWGVRKRVPRRSRRVFCRIKGRGGWGGEARGKLTFDQLNKEDRKRNRRKLRESQRGFAKA